MSSNIFLVASTFLVPIWNHSVVTTEIPKYYECFLDFLQDISLTFHVLAPHKNTAV